MICCVLFKKELVAKQNTPFSNTFFMRKFTPILIFPTRAPASTLFEIKVKYSLSIQHLIAFPQITTIIKVTPLIVIQYIYIKI